MIQKLIKQYWITITFVIAGGILGYAYWHFIGCTTGTCPLKSVWYYNTAFGLLSGYIVGDFIYDFKRKRTEKNTVQE